MDFLKYKQLCKNYTKIQIWDTPVDTNPSTRWKLIYNGDGSYRVLSESSGFVSALVIQEASTASGGKCIQHTYSGTPNEKWIFEKVG